MRLASPRHLRRASFALALLIGSALLAAPGAPPFDASPHDASPHGTIPSGARPGAVRAAQAAGPLTDATEISLITAYPGEDIWALWGHSALRIHDPRQGLDVMFNYGTFVFDALFVPRFVYGKLDYILWTTPFFREMRDYEQEQRTVVEQVLDLTPEQRDDLFRFLTVNAREENRAYRYQFLFDNCSTRIRDALKATLGDTLRYADTPSPQRSFRSLLDDPYLAGAPLLDLGIDLLLGIPVDRIATPWEVMFLPVNLMEAFDHARIVRDGAEQPLVRRTTLLSEAPGSVVPAAAFPLPGAMGWILLALGAALTWRQATRPGPHGRIADRLLFGLTGAAGLLMLFMWFGTLHTVTAYNMNLLWAWPTHLGAAFLLRRRPGWLRAYFAAAAVIGLVLVVGWTLWPQALPPAVLPVVLLLVLRGGWNAAAPVRRPPADRLADGKAHADVDTNVEAGERSAQP